MIIKQILFLHIKRNDEYDLVTKNLTLMYTNYYQVHKSGW